MSRAVEEVCAIESEGSFLVGGGEGGGGRSAAAYGGPVCSLLCECASMRSGPSFSGLRGSARAQPAPPTRLHQPPPSSSSSPSIINFSVPPLFICVWIATRASERQGCVFSPTCSVPLTPPTATRPRLIFGERQWMRNEETLIVFFLRQLHT